MEVIRKLCLVANWLCIGGAAVVLMVGGIFGDGIAILFGVGALVIAVVVHKVINWVFY